MLTFSQRQLSEQQAESRGVEEGEEREYTVANWAHRQMADWMRDMNVGYANMDVRTVKDEDEDQEEEEQEESFSRMWLRMWLRCQRLL